MEPFRDRIMFWTRVATSFVLAPIALGAVYYGTPALEVAVAGMAAAVIWEFVHISNNDGFPRRAVIVMVATLISVALATVNTLLGFFVIFFVWLGLFFTSRESDQTGSSSLESALLYGAVPAVCLIFVFEQGAAETIFWLLAVVWGTDIGGYAAGRLIGGPKLAPQISPNKTWSGAVGGLLAAAAAGLAVVFAAGGGWTPLALAFAAALSVVSQFGDLAESRFKRRHGVKDSGTWVPGHGGVMDRIDGLWAASPVAAVLCAVFDGGIKAW